jgi:hypothetical protein
MAVCVKYSTWTARIGIALRQSPTAMKRLMRYEIFRRQARHCMLPTQLDDPISNFTLFETQHENHGKSIGVVYSPSCLSISRKANVTNTDNNTTQIRASTPAHLPYPSYNHFLPSVRTRASLSTFLNPSFQSTTPVPLVPISGIPAPCNIPIVCSRFQTSLRRAICYFGEVPPAGRIQLPTHIMCSRRAAGTLPFNNCLA